MIKGTHNLLLDILLLYVVKKQDVIARLSTKDEFRGLENVLWLKLLLQDLGFLFE